MTPRATSRIERCTERDARTRLQDARVQLEHAALAEVSSTAEERKAAAACAVLAGIAAADAACCKALGQRSRSQNHRDAIGLVRQVQPGGADAARHLERLLGLKDQAHYGLQDVGGRRLLAARRQARALLEFAETVLGR